MYINKAFIFPGQGSQIVGMGKDYYQQEQVAKEVFDCVDETLGYRLSNIIFDGAEAELAITTHTQPAIMAVSMAILRTLQYRTGKNIEQLCQIVAGHSLGEYSALCASQALSLSDATKLLKIRAESMQTAVPVGQGAMAACIAIEKQQLLDIITDINTKQQVCTIANENCPGQLVISGHSQIVEQVIERLKALRYKAIKLKVSAPFHCPLMEPAAQAMATALAEVVVNTPKVPIIQNVCASAVTEPEMIKTNLIAQICDSVLWQQTMDYLAAKQCQSLVEIGPQMVLSNLAKRSGHDFHIKNIAAIADLANL